MADLIVERAFYEDRTASLNFEQVREQDFVPLHNLLHQGYSDSAFWVRIKVDDTFQGGKIAIKIIPTYLDEIGLYSEGRPEPWRLVGDRYPLANNGIKALGHNFIVDHRIESPYYWLRLKTVSTNLMDIEAIPHELLYESSVVEYIFSAMLLGVLGIFLLMSLGYFVASREVINGVFFLKQLLALLHASLFLGYVRLLTPGMLSPEVVDALFSYCVIATTFSVGLFYALFFKEYKIRAWANLLLWLCLLFIVLAGLMFAVGHRALALNINMMAIAVLSPLLVLIAIWGIPWRAIDKPVISRRALIGIQSANFVTGFLHSMPSLGAVTGTKFSIYVVMLHAIISSIFMLMIVRFRARNQEQQRLAELAMHAGRAEQEKQQREKQAQFMAMLTHELKTSLALIRFAARNALGRSQPAVRIEQAVDDMNSVIERCQQADKLERGWSFEKKKHSLVALVQECVDRLDNKERVQVSGIPDMTIFTDGALFRIILNNLLENALKYSPPGDPVVLQVMAPDSSPQMLLKVMNRVGHSGAPDKARVFEKYYRSDLAQTTTGSGLGLYIVRALTQLLGGQVDFAHEDETVIFSITLPL